MEILLAVLVLLSLVLHHPKVAAYVKKTPNKIDDKLAPAVDKAKDLLED
jgi:hypothetical protein